MRFNRLCRLHIGNRLNSRGPVYVKLVDQERCEVCSTHDADARVTLEESRREHEREAFRRYTYGKPTPGDLCLEELVDEAIEQVRHSLKASVLLSAGTLHFSSWWGYMVFEILNGQTDDLRSIKKAIKSYLEYLELEVEVERGRPRFLAWALDYMGVAANTTTICFRISTQWGMCEEHYLQHLKRSEIEAVNIVREPFCLDCRLSAQMGTPRYLRKLTS